ncbi:Sugar efflux transporter A [Lacunisphaera limnophila]|uniref:Sugar efflux transporter A n=1 Tax=Lacunisphaera limnophila TaxID=1838286 RepID=A0A1D8AZ91_9BACT|nr:sugar efflux transporter [Lacunisphaera limnophila]AOS46216.1 Sugar efflux transporter A [Lacunisphaera limnophila]
MKALLAPWRRLLGHREFGIMALSNLVLGMAYSFVAPFYSMFGTLEVGMTNWVFGVFMTVTSLSGIVITTFLSRWSDTRISRRAILLLACVCGVAGYAGYAYVRDVIWLTVIGSLALGVSSITFAQLFAYQREFLTRHGVPDAEAPLYMNIFRLLFSLAWTIGPAIAAWVMIKYSYEGIFLTCAAMFGLLFVIVWRYIPARPPTAAAMANKVPLSQVLRRPYLLCYFAAFVLVFICVTMGMMNLPLLILQTLGGTAEQVGIAFSVAPVFELPLMFWFGLLASRSHPGRLIRIGMIIAVAYYALLFFVTQPWHIYPLQILSAAMIAVVSGIAITFFQSYIPDQPGTATNLYTTANRIGSTIGYLSFGSLAGSFGYRAIFLVCAVLCSAAFLLLWLSREKHEQAVAPA